MDVSQKKRRLIFSPIYETGLIEQGAFIFFFPSQVLVFLPLKTFDVSYPLSLKVQVDDNTDEQILDDYRPKNSSS